MLPIEYNFVLPPLIAQPPGAGAFGSDRIGVIFLLIEIGIVIFMAFVAGGLVYVFWKTNWKVQTTTVTILGLICFSAAGWYAMQRHRIHEYHLVTDAGYQCDASHSETSWLQRLVFNNEPLNWYELNERDTENLYQPIVPTALLPQQLSRIISHHSELERVALGTGGGNEDVLRVLASFTKLERLEIETLTPIPDEWTKWLAQKTPWKSLHLRCPGLTSAGAIRILQRCTELEELGIPANAVDKNVRDAIIARPQIYALSIYYDSDAGYSPESVRLLQEFSGRILNISLIDKKAVPMPTEILAFANSQAEIMRIDGIASVEVQDARGVVEAKRCGNVKLSGILGHAEVVADRVTVEASSKLKVLVVTSLEADVVDCRDLNFLEHRRGRLRAKNLPNLDFYYAAERPEWDEGADLRPQFENCRALATARLRLGVGALDETMLALATLPNLKTLSIDLEQTNLDHPWFEHISKLMALEHLVLEQPATFYANKYSWSKFRLQLPPSVKTITYLTSESEWQESKDWQEFKAKFSNITVEVRDKYKFSLGHFPHNRTPLPGPR